ncbi:helix-turn-helix domain-containing protein [Chryseobacterium shandongense]|uniref:Helix-turn-helix domain-containing protein n=1 Tax=Chryseobacterium shandongense TaxID=1493872 RepID=A0AAD0YB89_9FLAO|nr:helix-turn-helix domain-containing protein [Chryseobacterium shandongense]AZA86070.1 helix-turn-helix domain-containing protein [Chryseobacterium shandongense]AZA94478.1 helix-turn-helix domain-containing protein [Chryseobacterium shandongense]
MKKHIKTLQLSHLEKMHHLQNEVLIFPIAQLLSKINVNKHFRNRFYTLLLYKEAGGTVIIDDQLYELRNDSLFFLNYNQVYYFNPTSAPEGFAVLFTKSFYNYIYTGNKLIKSDTAMAEMPQMIDLSASSVAEFWQNFYIIRKEYGSNRMFAKEMICMQLKILILRCIRASKITKEPGLPADHKKEVVTKFSELVNHFYKELKTTAPYAEKLNITPNYLNALIKQHLALSAGQFIKNRVILEAERLLLHTNLSVTEISYELGFTDNSHFGKYFKSVTKKSPKIYRIENKI